MNQRDEEGFRGDIVEVGRRMYARGYVASNDGNISIRLDDKTILTTPKSVSKGFMTPDMMVVVGLDGKKIRGTAMRHPSCSCTSRCTESSGRAAVVHAHPPIATGFAVAAFRSIAPCSPRSSRHSAAFPSRSTARRRHPSCRRQSESTSRRMRAAARKPWSAHGRTRRVCAYYKMETIEHFAKISLVTRQLGRENLLSREEVPRLQELRGNYGIKAPAPICADGSSPRATIRHPARSSKRHRREARGSFHRSGGLPPQHGGRVGGPRMWTGKFGYHTASLRPSLRMP